MHAVEVHLITGSVNNDFLALAAVPGLTFSTLYEVNICSRAGRAHAICRKGLITSRNVGFEKQRTWRGSVADEWRKKPMKPQSLLGRDRKQSQVP